MWIMTARICERFHVLPAAGGVFDQDPEVLTKLSFVTNVLDEFDEKDQKRQLKSSE
jgi:hypothetical protein